MKKVLFTVTTLLFFSLSSIAQQVQEEKVKTDIKVEKAEKKVRTTPTEAKVLKIEKSLILNPVEVTPANQPAPRKKEEEAKQEEK